MKLKVHQLKGYIQTIYLVETEHGLLLLDGCCRSDVNLVLSFITNDLNRTIKDLKLVISTHAHPDHAGGLSFFKKRGIQIAGPKDLNKYYSGISGWFTYITDILLTYLVAINKKRGLKNIFFPRSVILDFELSDGDLVPQFPDWTILECPGHTNTDLTIYHGKEKMAYVADNFVGNNKKVFRPYPIMLPDLYKKTLQRYIDLEIETFLIAHHGQIKIPKKKIEELIKTSSSIPRRHLNTLPTIFIKLIKSLYKKSFFRK